MLAASLLVAIAMPASPRGDGSAQALTLADQALQAGEPDRALVQLSSLPQGGAGSAKAQNLACRIHYTLQQWDTAVQECSRAVSLDSQNWSYHMWLGRALGKKAANASFLSAFSVAKQTRAEFESAVRLDPKSPAALSDLGDFYRAAPGIVGGGLDKATQIANQLQPLDQRRALQLQGLIAENQSDYATAEQKLKQSVQATAHPAWQWTTLAGFYGRRKRWTDMDAAVHSAETEALKDKDASVALYDGAGVLIDNKKDSALAAKLLQEYLSTPYKTEEAPVCEAHVRLAKLKKQMGDAAGAQYEISAALALAHDYKPALEFKH